MPRGCHQTTTQRGRVTWLPKFPTAKGDRNRVGFGKKEVERVGFGRSVFFCFISVRKIGAQDSLGNQISVRSTRFYNQTKKKINEAVSARAGEGSSVLDKFFLFWVNQARRCVCAANIGLHTISLAWNEGFPFIKKKIHVLVNSHD